MRLISPATWRAVDRAQLQPHEVPTALRAVHLNSSGTGATRPFVAVGTSFSVGAPPDTLLQGESSSSFARGYVPREVLSPTASTFTCSLPLTVAAD